MGKKSASVGGNEVQSGAAETTSTLPAATTDAAQVTEPVQPVMDEFHGRGGSYVVHDATQTRKPNN